MSAPGPRSERRARRLGGLALACYGVHAGWHLWHGHAEDLLWACHLAAVLVGIGWLTGSARLNAIGFLWLCLGDALWVLDLLAGGELLPTSLLTHVGGLAIAAAGVGRWGIPRGSGWQALAAFLALQQLCRWLTPAQANVNLAHAVWPGWEETFPSYALYLVFLMAVGAVVFTTLEQAIRRLAPAMRRNRET